MNRENFKVYKVNIIGGGFAGMISAIALCDKFNPSDIIITERNDRVGKKILSTGNGQCNITNKDIKVSRFHGKNPNFANSVLTRFSNEFLINFFKKLGLLITDDGDKYYPASKQASSVLDALRFKLNHLGVTIKTCSEAIGTNKEKYFITTLSSGEKIYSQNLIIASGGKSAKHTGSTGSGYEFAKSFGHKIEALYPSLVQLKCNAQEIKGLKGLKQYSKLYGVVNGKTVTETYGDVLFTEYGISGNAVFSVSAYLSGESNKAVVIDLCPKLTENELTDFLNEKIKACPYLKVEDLFSGIINKKVASAVLKNSLNLNLESDISTVNVISAVKAVKQYTLNITGDTGFDNSQVTRGGVRVSEVNEETMESKLIKGLYFIGEVLDIDGDCGGFNLQWAFSSAMASAKAVK